MFALTCTTSRVAAAPGSAGADRAKLARVGSRASGSHSQASRIGRRVCLGGAGHGGRAVRTAATEGETPSEQYTPPVFAGENFDKTAVFPRVKEKDPYRRLGVDAEASYEEVQDARNYLVDTFRGHAVGVESIEAAFDRIIQDKLSVRKKAKGLRMAKKKQGGENYVPPFMERLKAQFARPDDQTILRRAIIYSLFAGWAIVQRSASGPAFQMAIAFGLTVFFLHEKRGKQKELLGKAFLNVFVALVLGWLVGSIFPVYIPIFPQAWGPELILSLFSFVSFFVFATFLK